MDAPRFALDLPIEGDLADPALLADLALGAERAGWGTSDPWGWARGAGFWPGGPPFRRAARREGIWPIARLGGIGMTWWIEPIGGRGFSLAEIRDRITAGPPRG